MPHSATRLLSGLVLLLLCIGLADAREVSASASSWQRQVAAISAGHDTAGRAAAITARLRQMGLSWRAEPFSHEGQSGINLVADVGGPADAPLLLIGAHYDRVAVGHGATDNASGVAAVLELAQALQARPLARHRVQVVFWDLEEMGLLGSLAWVATPDRERPALYVNFDVYGWGDTLWMMTPQADDPLAAALRPLAQAQGLQLVAGLRYPPTDHLAFQKAGWPAVSFSRVDGGEIEGILQVFTGQVPATPPKVMEVIHSPRDTVVELETTNLSASLIALEQALRQWDAR